MNTQTQEALKMAIETIRNFKLIDYGMAEKAIQACKEALEQEKTPEEVIKNHWDNFKEL